MLSYQDLIYRGDAVLAISERIHQIGRENDPDVLSLRQAIREVSAARERPALRGNWYLGSDMKLHCSACDKVPYNKIIMNSAVVFDLSPIREMMKYCPNCGARMEES